MISCKRVDRNSSIVSDRLHIFEMHVDLSSLALQSQRSKGHLNGKLVHTLKARSLTDGPDANTDKRSTQQSWRTQSLSLSESVSVELLQQIATLECASRTMNTQNALSTGKVSRIHPQGYYFQSSGSQALALAWGTHSRERAKRTWQTFALGWVGNQHNSRFQSPQPT